VPQKETPYRFTAKNVSYLVAALRAAHDCIADFIEGQRPIANKLENYFMEMTHAQGEEFEGVLIDGFLEDIETQLLEQEDKPAELFTLGTANASPKARKRTPEVKKKE